MVNSNRLERFRFLAKLTVVVTLCVVLLGAWVRLSDAGLGCPDWPGCYGTLLVPQAEHAVQLANEAFPHRPVEVDKAWKEMIHRYLASALGLLIIGLAWLAWRNRAEQRQPVMLPLLLVGLVIFQGMLGMWTVTLQLKPVIVMGHLLGGFATLALLWWLALSTSERLAGQARELGLVVLVLLGIVLLLVQIALGGWTSSNYAALACPDFPRCQQQWWPQMDFREAFVMWRGIGPNYEFGVLEHPARTAIHMVHRIGAVVVVSYFLFLIIMVRRNSQWPLSRRLALWVLGLLLVQVSLGISNIVFHLPLFVAVAHNGVAALLLLSLLALLLSLTRQNELITYRRVRL